MTWVEGEEAKELLPSLFQKEQYDFGYEAGQMMLKMQTVESYQPSSDWAKIYGKRVKKYIEAYKACGGTVVCSIAKVESYDLVNRILGPLNIIAMSVLVFTSVKKFKRN